MNCGDILHHLGAVFWPYRCLVCGRGLAKTQLCGRCSPGEPLGPGQSRCASCFAPWASAAERCSACCLNPPLFERQRFLWSYDGAVREILRIIKYRPSKRLAMIIAEIAAPRLIGLFAPNDWDAIVPMPATARSLRARGFNLCALVARAAARQTAAPLLVSALQHRGSTHAQASLPHAARIGNVARSFRCAPRRVAGKRILLIDDVATTGATSAAAAAALQAGGAAAVDLATLARAAAWDEFRAAIDRRFGAG